MPTRLNLYKNPCNWCMFTQMVLMVVSFKSQPNYFKACLIKWTTSGEPPVGLKITRALNWVTVQLYFIFTCTLFFYCDPVYFSKTVGCLKIYFKIV